MFGLFLTAEGIAGLALVGLFLLFMVASELMYKCTERTLYQGAATADFSGYHATGGMPGAETGIKVNVPGRGTMPFVVMHGNASWFLSKGRLHEVVVEMREAVSWCGRERWIDSIHFPKEGKTIYCGQWAVDETRT